MNILSRIHSVDKNILCVFFVFSLFSIYIYILFYFFLDNIFPSFFYIWYIIIIIINNNSRHLFPLFSVIIIIINWWFFFFFWFNLKNRGIGKWKQEWHYYETRFFPCADLENILVNHWNFKSFMLPSNIKSNEYWIVLCRAVCFCVFVTTSAQLSFDAFVNCTWLPRQWARIYFACK